MKIRFEFTGAAREITGKRIIPLDIPHGASYRDIIHHVAEQYPDLLGVYIDKNSLELSSGCLLSRNAVETIMPDDMKNSPQDGDHLILLVFIVGG